MRRMTLTVLGLAVLLLLPFHAWGETGSVALVGQVGLRGLGGEVVVGVAEQLNFRAGAAGFSYNYSGSQDDIDYDIDFGLLSYSAMGDYYAMGGGFRVTGGLILNKNKIDLTAEPGAVTYTIGDQEYRVSDVGALTGRVDFNDTAPYIGIGWGNPVGSDKQLGFMVDLGAMIQGSPNVTMNATGAISTDEEFKTNLDREEGKVEDDLSAFKIYPVLSIGITYKFK